MKIAFNPSTVAALITPPNNKDITFDLRGRNIFARGVKFCGTDTWRDIKINNVSIGSNILDLRNGSNTTLTNTNGVVTINSTWRPVVDNLTSDSTTSSLSANLGRVLAGLISTLSTNISNLYALRDGSNATGRWRGGLACLDVRDTNYTPHDLNMGLELHFFNNNTNNLKDGGKYNGVFSFRQLASGSDWSGGKAHLLSFTDNGNIWHRTSSGDDSWGTWKKLAYSTDIPSSLKNPYALTISLNGTSQGPYDGSAAKNINITPGSIGAAVSNHSHDYLVVNSADDKSFNSAYHNFLVLYAGGGNKITGKPANVDAFGLFKFRAASGCSGQMLLANGGSLYIRSSEDAKMTNTLAWKTILDSSNYSGILDSRYYTESEVNSLLDAKLNRQNLSYGTWNPRGYHLAADYYYNGGDLSISESGGKIHVSIDGYFWLNEGQYRVLDTSDVAGLKSNLTVHLYLSATDAAWYPLVWGGNAHQNTSDSTGAVYKSYDKLSWQTSSLTLYATNIQTNNIKNLSIGGGIYWNPNVESASDNTDAASITLVRSGVAGGTTLVLSLMNDTNDTILFKTNTAARLYHNNYPILTTLNTYVSNNKGYINGLEITLVNNADTLDGAHLSDIKNWSDRTASAYWKAGWYKVASAQTATNTEAFLTLDVNAAKSNGHATLFIRKRADSKPYFICTHNNNLNLADFRLYYNGMSMVLYARVPNDWNGRVFRIISEGREGKYNHIWTLYSNVSSTDPNAISAEGGNPYINPTYSGRVDWSNSSDKANYANSAGSVAWNNVTGKPSAFNPAAHTHTVFKNNLMIKGTNGISDSASIHLGIGDSDTGFKWISDGVCLIYANNAAVGLWTSGGMNWFKNPTVNGNKVWNAGNDGSGSGLDADLLDGWHLDSIRKNVGYSWSAKYRINNWSRIIKIDNYSNILLAINFSQNSQVSNHLYLISTGYGCGNIVQLGANGYSSNSAIKIRLTENTATSHNVEIYSTYGYNGATELSINCNYTRIDGNSTITTYLTYTAGGGTVRKEITSSYSKIVANLQGNSDTTTKLQTPRQINGTNFDGSANITTSYWGTTRTISLTGAVTGSVSTNGSENITINTTYGTGNITNLDNRYVKKAGDTMLGNLAFASGKQTRWTAHGTSYITDGNANSGTSLGSNLANLVISSWLGVSFTTSCSGQTYTNKTAVGINCRTGIVYAANFVGPLQGNASSATNADTVDGYHASGLWRSDGATWNPGANVSLNASANNQEWSFDIRRNGYTGCYWHVWDSNRGTLLTVNADNGKVYAPYNFGGNLEGNASSATKVIVNLNTTNDANYPLVWSNLSNTNTVTENQLYKSWSDLYYNPKNKRLTVGGSIYAAHFYESSDKTLKKNIKSILSSTNIPKIREFDWKDTGEHSYGFIALELEELGYGCLVSEANGKKTVNYTATLALTVAKLLNLINIQNKKISNLTKELKALKYGRKKNS